MGDRVEAAWREWLERPERLWWRQLLFQIHLWVGSAVSVYIIVMSVTGSAIVFRNELLHWLSVESVVKLHANLLAGTPGRMLNGIGALCLTVLCITGAVIWWPGLGHWRRSLTIESRAHVSRIMWDIHSALGFWTFLFLLMWALSGLYLSIPRWFDVLLWLDPKDRLTDRTLSGLSQAHFGRFGLFAEGVWTGIGLVPGRARAHWRVYLLPPRDLQEIFESEERVDISRGGTLSASRTPVRSD
jgi:hypothetical protein